MTPIKLFFILSFCTFFARANVVGTHLQNFNPTTNGLDFVTVHSANTLEPGIFNLSLFTNYATNSLPFFKLAAAPSGQKFSEPNDELLSADIGLGLGIAENWDAGIGVATIYGQSVDNSANLSQFDEKGVTEFKFNTKYRFVNNEKWGLATIASLNIDRIDNNPFSGQDPGPTFNLEMAYHRFFRSDLLFGFNLGYRFRDEGQAILNSGVTPVEDQVLYSAALAYYYKDDLHFIFELYGSTPTEEVSYPVDREDSNLEALAGVKYMVASDINLHGGIGSELYHGLASPDVRVYLGLTWQFGPFWRERAEPKPIPEPTVITKLPARITLYDLNFKKASVLLEPGSRQSLETTIQQLREQKDEIQRIVVEGHTDSSGTERLNLTLSKGRAATVRDILLQELQMRPEQIESVGFGESQPIASNNSAQGKKKNRRVELRIYKFD